MTDGKRRKILAASSGGGHWEQLMAMRAAFDGSEVIFATTIPGLLKKYDIRDGLVLPDCSRDSITMSSSKDPTSLSRPVPRLDCFACLPAN